MNQVQNRIWLMHWSLFIFFNHDNGRTQIIDLFNQDKYAFLIKPAFLYPSSFVYRYFMSHFLGQSLLDCIVSLFLFFFFFFFGGGDHFLLVSFGHNVCNVSYLK